MGVYQMLKGAHFLSHTVSTMLLSLLIIQVAALMFGDEPAANASAVAPLPSGR
jgi:membrane-associated PAP2 superfamily phosphatase